MFSIVWQYNDTFYATLFMPSANLLSSSLSGLGSAMQFHITNTISQGARDPFWVQLVVNAGMVLFIAPIIIIYLVVQRQFMEGIERSGIVG
jgi:multiple sugar transport system permease protein